MFFNLFFKWQRVVAPNMPLGLGRIWLIMWLYQCLFSLILHLSVHISAWEDRRCLYFKQSNGWASHLERRCQLRARMVAGEGGRPPLPPNTHTSLRKFSFLVPEFLSGSLNSFWSLVHLYKMGVKLNILSKVCWENYVRWNM